MIECFKCEYDVVVMVDCGLVDDGLFVVEVGVDFIGMMLCGYIGECFKVDGFDYEVIEVFVKKFDGDCFVIVEGCIYILD